MKSWNRPITNDETEVIIKSFLTYKGMDHRFTAEFHQTFKEYLMPTVTNLFHKIEKKNAIKFILKSQFYPESR